MRLSEFWESDPAECVRYIRAAVLGIDSEHRRLLHVAWHCAAIQRAQRMPKLKDIMPPELDHDGRTRRRKQFETPQQEWAMWEAIAVSANAMHEQRVKAGLE